MNAEDLNRKMHKLTGGIGTDWVKDGWHLLMAEMEEHSARPQLEIGKEQSWFSYVDAEDERQRFPAATEGEAVVTGYIVWSGHGS